jgi:chain length determinant protein EpsF
MNFLQYLSILQARRTVILAILGAAVALGVAASLLLPKSYSATTSVLVDVKSNDPTGGVALGTALLPETLQAYLATQAEVIASERGTSRAMKLVELEKDPALRATWMASTVASRVGFEDWLAERVRRKLVVSPSRDRNIIEITFEDSDPKRAAAVANAFARAYLETDLELKVDPARTSAAFFDERSQAVRAKLEQAQSKLSAFQRNRGILVSDEKFDVENARLAELSSQLTLLQGAAVEAESRRRQAGSLSDVTQSPAVQGLRAELAKSEAKLRDVSTQYGPNHPQYQRIEAEVRLLREAVAAETGRAAGSVGASARVAREREAQVRAAYDAQRKRVLEMKVARDEAFLLMRDVENATKEYDALQARLGQTNLESQVRQSNVRVLNRATEPLYPSSPKVLLNLVAAVFLGLVAGITTAFALEALDRRIRDAHDAGETLRLPVLAVLAPPSGRSLPGETILRLPGAPPRIAG